MSSIFPFKCFIIFERIIYYVFVFHFLSAQTYNAWDGDQSKKKISLIFDDFLFIIEKDIDGKSQFSQYYFI